MRSVCPGLGLPGSKPASHLFLSSDSVQSLTCEVAFLMCMISQGSLCMQRAWKAVIS